MPEAGTISRLNFELDMSYSNSKHDTHHSQHTALAFNRLLPLTKATLAKPTRLRINSKINPNIPTPAPAQHLHHGSVGCDNATF